MKLSEITKEIRKTIKKDIPFLIDAYIVFYDDITMDGFQKAQDAQATNNTDGNLQLMADQIVEWNFTDENNFDLPITIETLKKLPLKLLNWIATIQVEILNPKAEQDKKKELEKPLLQP